MINQVYIGTDRVDLYGDENVEIISSVLDISDITLNTTDYSKSFAVPASKSNNKLFKHWYNADIDGGFDARTKVSGTILLAGKPFKTGKWRLQKVNLKKGKPSSYTINFFGDLTSLVDTLKKDELSDLDLSAYNHEYISGIIKSGLVDSVTTGIDSAGSPTVIPANDLIYNLFVKKQYYINSTSGDNTQTETLANISYGGGPLTGVVWDDLRPSIKLLAIIEAIETDYGLTFTRDFFGTTEFSELYLWINPSQERETGGASQRVNWDGGSSFWMDQGTDVGTYISTSSPVRFFFNQIRVIPSAGYEAFEYTIKTYVDGESVQELVTTGEDVSSWDNLDTLDVNNSVYYEVICNQEFKYTATLRQNQLEDLTTLIRLEITTATENTIDSVFVVSEEMPKLKIIDFLKGLFNAYKLIVITQPNGDIYIDSLNSYYSKGNLYDITKYVDFESVDVERGKILNEISFKFAEPTTILNKQFEKLTGLAFGDEEALLNDDLGEPLDGDSLTFKLPFEQFVYERLRDINDTNNGTNRSNVMYGAIIDEELAPASPKPHIFYSQRIAIQTKTIAFVDEIGGRVELSGQLNVPTHANNLISGSFSTIFGAEFNEWDGILIENTLYKNHHEQYVLDIFNIKKRSFKYTAQMPSFIMTNLALNDVVKIRENYYRINKFNYNLLTDKTTFDLINSFDNDLSQFTSSTTSINTLSPAITEIISITNSVGATSLKVDAGDGTAWITDSIGATVATFNKLTLAIDENTTAFNRMMFVVVTQAVTGTEITITITQQAKATTFDSDIIKFDSDLITFDKI